MFVLSEIVKKIPERSQLSRLSFEQKLKMYEMKIAGESNDTISKWLLEECDVAVTPKVLFRTFKNTIPDLLLKQNKIIMFEPEQMDTRHIDSLEKLAEFQFQRIKAQYFDELEQMGDPKINNETGEIDYSGVNKNLNETINTYNRLVKTIYELKMSIGLIRKVAEEKNVKHTFTMGSAQRDAIKRMIQSNLSSSNRLDKFRQSPADTEITSEDSQLPTGPLLLEGIQEDDSEIIEVVAEQVKDKV